MKQFIATGWTVNDSSKDSKLLESLDGQNKNIARINKDQWHHSATWLNSSNSISHYQSDNISLILVGRPTIKNKAE